MMMMPMAKTIGRATSRAASPTRRAMLICSVDRSSRCRNIFSIITTAPSTIMPMPIASPPRLIRFADKPVKLIAMNAISTESGSVSTTISVERMLPRKR